MTPDLVRLENIHLRRGARVILDRLSLAVAPGEIVAVMGPSGSGKTTILRTIAGLETFEAGTVTIDDVRVEAGPPAQAAIRALRRKVGMVFQFHCLFEHLTAAHNVWLAPVHVHGVAVTEARQRALDLLRTLGVEHRAGALPRELSGGEAQRVAIARALATDPPLLLMDEPTASLDPSRRTELGSILRALVSGRRALVIATHDEEFARSTATRIVRVGEDLLAS